MADYAGDVPVAVVTDSTSYLPEGFADRHGVRVVPLTVLIDGAGGGKDGIDVTSAQLTAALRAREAVSTSMATPGQLAEVYRRELDAGASAVVSVHLSAGLSGTVESARFAAKEVCAERGAGVVRVVDSRSTVMGLGFAVLHAATAAAGGADAASVAAAAEATAAASTTVFVVETLEYLRRGGRIGAATALLGSALAVKPLLHIADGRIVPLEKVRTTERAIARLVDIARRAAADRPVELAVHHLAAAERAASLADRLTEQIPTTNGCVIAELGAVIGAHTGPGVLGVVVQPQPRS